MQGLISCFLAVPVESHKHRPHRGPVGHKFTAAVLCSRVGDQVGHIGVSF
jgi:hypothetical protein